eukprot:14483-Heterococcus_DN1.PRE.2
MRYVIKCQQDAADMILADDNFATIVSAVEEGRAIYNNMQYKLDTAATTIAIAAAVTITLWLVYTSGIHLLPDLLQHWVNLVTDGPPATALGFNPPDPDAMSKPPRPREEPIMSTWLLTRYMCTGLYVGFATI